MPQVFDVTNRPSFESLSSWMVEAAKYGAPGKMVSRLTSDFWCMAGMISQ
jgi:hypothetical protein